jgi:hypothetical protein
MCSLRSPFNQKLIVDGLIFEAGLTLDFDEDEHLYPRPSKSHDYAAQGLHEFFLRRKHLRTDELRLKNSASSERVVTTISDTFRNGPKRNEKQTNNPLREHNHKALKELFSGCRDSPATKIPRMKHQLPRVQENVIAKSR